MKNFKAEIISIGNIKPYIQVDFDGIHMDKDLVKTMLVDTKGVDHVNVNERGSDKYRAIVYPATYCDSEEALQELEELIDNTLNRL